MSYDQLNLLYTIVMSQFKAELLTINKALTAKPN